MKLWIGKEKEGRDRNLTLFVKAKSLESKDILKILEVAQCHNVSRIYFGAGRTDVDVNGFKSCVIRRIRALLKHKYQMVIETSPDGLEAAASLAGMMTVVVRFECHAQPSMIHKNSIQIKFDNCRWIGVSDSVTWNSLKNLHGDLYSTDKEVF